ncbi:MAG: hypothetical protein HYY93_12030 [Planctomycetes bacterium]|nr:hypothetical protein [Planctomycetota bacterium]
MSLLGPYTVQDYYQLYQRRNDADALSSWEHINGILFRKLKLVLLLVLLSVGAAFAIHSFTEKAVSVADQIQKRLNDPKAFARELTQNMSPEERQRLIDDLKKEIPKETGK